MLTLSPLIYCTDAHVNTVYQVGLDAAGKTTILYKLKLGEIVTTIPTIGAFFTSVRLATETYSTK